MLRTAPDQGRTKVEVNESRRLYDGDGRRVRYLRMSVTDRCELQCVYCFPAGGLTPFDIQLTFDEIVRLVGIGVGMGIEKIRLTGGEPLARAGVTNLVARLAEDRLIQDLSLTTNGTRLERMAPDLKRAGLDRINVSVDSLDPVIFAKVRKGARLDSVLRGIDRALEAGLPVKVNAVLLKGITETEAARFVRYAIERSLEMRFIEYMPLNGSSWNREEFLPADAVRKRIEEEFPLSEVEEQGEADRVASVFRVDGTGARVGFIATFSRPFCDTCSRLRISSRGGIRLCLFSPLEASLLPMLRRGEPDEDIEAFIRRLMVKKPKGHGISMNRLMKDPSQDHALIRTVGG